VMGCFLATGVWIGLVGACVGVAAGFGIVEHADAIIHGLAWCGWDAMKVYVEEVQHLAGVPVHHRPSAMGFLVLATAVSSAVFSLLPAWRAARLDPVRAIRGA